jgi:hypothetical protein
MGKGGPPDRPFQFRTTAPAGPLTAQHQTKLCDFGITQLSLIYCLRRRFRA